MHYPALIGTALASLMVACTSVPGSGDAPSLEGTRWHLDGVSGVALEIPSTPSIDLRFFDGRLHFYGCNALSGRYVQKDHQLQVPKGFVGTRMSCNQELMDIDTAATQLFETGVNFQYKRDTLTLTGNHQRWEFSRDHTENNNP